MPSTAEQAVIDSTGYEHGWEYVDGPETGVGIEFYLSHKEAGTFYVCIDQGEVTVCSSVS